MYSKFLKKISALLAAGLLVFMAASCQKKQEAGKAAGNAAPGAETSGIKWYDYTEGMDQSKITGKPVMIVFYTTWCKYCQKLDQTTLSDPAVVQLVNSNFIAIKVNAEGEKKVKRRGKEMSEKEVAADYQVTGFPTVWFIDGKSEPIGSLPGYMPPEDFKPYLSYISSGSFAKKVPFQEYLKGLKK
jgi:thioredoxin-related protein